MSFSKNTTVAGEDAGGNFKFQYLSGFWSVEAAMNNAKRCKFADRITVEHVVHDNSGRGRGGHDGRWAANLSTNSITLLEEWREGSKIKKPETNTRQVVIPNRVE
jgi:hypothetical protein|tara:strand:+ start:1725 stop:2039 length:315 start_codon:yes stop_codon:yes gene_type:complete